MVIGAVLVPGHPAPNVITREQLASLKIDVAIDQGGAFETSKATTYAEPIHIEEGARHYCVANMPGGVPRTSTKALTNATSPYLRRLAAHGPTETIEKDAVIARGVNTRGGKLVHEGVLQAWLG